MSTLVIVNFFGRRRESYYPAKTKRPDATPLGAAIQQFVLIADAHAPEKQSTALRSILAGARVDVPKQIVKLTFRPAAAAVPQIA
ncbi:MAG: hypothetical protein HY286_06960 [Planctomycetes bacterium]|nr:hypothetical protein [Planctomycetota bacterium]